MPVLMRNVYYDVENTLDAPFITGIQRVVREFSKIVLAEDVSTMHRYVPVVYDHKRFKWRNLDQREARQLLSLTPISTSILSRVIRKMRRFFPKPSRYYVNHFEQGSIFLDIESSWHSQYKRKQLLSVLKKSGLKLVKVHYDIIPLLFPETTHPNTVKVFTGHFLSHLEYSDMFLCISKSTFDDVSQYCEQNMIPMPQLRTIQLGTDFQIIDKVDANNSLPSDTCKYGKYILSVGTVEPRKNYLLLIKAFNRIRDKTDLNVVIVGKTGWLAEEICSEIQNHPDFGSRVYHLDSVPDQQLYALYRNAWLSVTPSKYEGFGLPVVESLALGCPTICSTGGSLKEVAVGYVLHFSPDSIDELTNIILSLYCNIDEYDDLRRLAQSYKPDGWHKTIMCVDEMLHELD